MCLAGADVTCCSVSEAHVRAEIVRLGVQHQLTSKHTSYVAVQERNPAAQWQLYLGPVRTRPVTPPAAPSSFTARETAGVGA